jgi:dephospho-CoA kinase
MRRRSRALQTPYCIWVIPLLLETGKTALVERVLVVDTPESLQRQRVLGRAGMDEDTLEAILRSQVSRSERLHAADDVIVNNADLNHLQQQVTALHHQYLALANAGSPQRKND